MKTLFNLLVVALLSFSMVLAVPSVGDQGSDPTYGAGNNYEVCRADTQSAWVSADSRGTFSPQNVCEFLGYNDVEAWGGTCGDVCGFCGQQGNEFYNGAGGDENFLRYTVHWLCVDYEGSNDNGNDEEVPEFGLVAGVLAAAGILGFVVYKRRQ